MNHATIDLESPSEVDMQWMKDLIGEFVAETDSVIGKQILDSWDIECYKFIKVIPVKY
jgi:glutamate synthase domain-containing protein 3